MHSADFLYAALSLQRSSCLQTGSNELCISCKNETFGVAGGPLKGCRVNHTGICVTVRCRFWHGTAACVCFKQSECCFGDFPVRFSRLIRTRRLHLVGGRLQPGQATVFNPVLLRLGDVPSEGRRVKRRSPDPLLNFHALISIAKKQKTPDDG